MYSNDNILRGTKRKAYSASKVRKMRSEHILTRAKKEGVTNDQVQHYLGKLQAAGHMRLGGMTSFDVKSERSGNELSENIINTTTNRTML